MFKMKYVNGIYPVSYTCYHERFHNCNACTFTMGTATIFQSYQTPIAALDTFEGVRHLAVNPYYDCSPTTRKQFSRWLRENGLPSYQQVKYVLSDAEPDTGELWEYEDSNTVIHYISFDRFISAL